MEVEPPIPNHPASALNVVSSNLQPAAAVSSAPAHIDSHRACDYLNAGLALKDFFPEQRIANRLRINPSDPIDESQKAHEEMLKKIPRTLHNFYFLSLANLPKTEWYKRVTSGLVENPGNLEYLFRYRAFLETKVLWAMLCTGESDIEPDTLRSMIILQEIANDSNPEMEDMKLWAKGQLFSNPDGVHEENRAAAEACFKASAELGNAHSQNVLGHWAWVHSFKNGYDKAMRWFMPAAMQGNLWAQKALAKIYLDNPFDQLPKPPEKAFWIVPKYDFYHFSSDDSKEAAALLLEAAAIQGDNRAKYDLAELYRKGFVSRKDVDHKTPDGARKWTAQKEVALYQSAAAEGYAPAQSRLNYPQGL